MEMGVISFAKDGDQIDEVPLIKNWHDGSMNSSNIQDQNKTKNDLISAQSNSLLPITGRCPNSLG
jgi:hypothetical protein